MYTLYNVFALIADQASTKRAHSERKSNRLLSTRRYMFIAPLDNQLFERPRRGKNVSGLSKTIAAPHTSHQPRAHQYVHSSLRVIQTMYLYRLRQQLDSDHNAMTTSNVQVCYIIPLFVGFPLIRFTSCSQRQTRYPPIYCIHPCDSKAPSGNLLCRPPLGHARGYHPGRFPVVHRACLEEWLVSGLALRR